jgi:hypothetical protein
MKLPEDIKIYGDTSYRGQCPPETAEQVTFFARIRKKYPDYGAVAIHPRNEGKRNYLQIASEKAEGLTKGATDIIIPGSPAFVCELKRRDHTKSSIHKEQEEYLYAAKRLGCFVCIALGVDAAEEAFTEYLAGREKSVGAHRGRSKWRNGTEI